MNTNDKFRRQTFVVTWFAYMGYYLTRKSFVAAKVGILQDSSIHITEHELANIDLMFGIAYVIGQFIMGNLADKFGARKIVIPGMLFSILISVAMGISSSVIAFGVFFFLQGLAQSTGGVHFAKTSQAGTQLKKEEGHLVYGRQIMLLADSLERPLRHSSLFESLIIGDGRSMLQHFFFS